MIKLDFLKKISLILGLIFFAFISSASYSEEELKAYFWIIIGSCAVVGIGYLIVNSIQNKNRKQRNALKSEFEQTLVDFEVTYKAGSDRCSVYYDEKKCKLKIIAIQSSGISEKECDNVMSNGLFKSADVILSIDNKAKKALVISSSGQDISIKEISYLNESSIKSTMLPIVKEWDGNFFIVDSENGIVACCNKNGGKTYSFTPSLDTDQQIEFSRFSAFSIKQYAFMRDEINNRLFVIERNMNLKGDNCIITPIDYEDIIKVELVEDGNTISSRSTSRTVGGALVGGALLGGAGAVVGGLSGKTTSVRKVSKLDVNILLRRAKSNKISINFVNDRIYDLSKPDEQSSYNEIYNNAVKAKDIIEVIIDKMERVEKDKIQNLSQPQKNSPISVADEIIKLSKLKEDGIISSEEFDQFKKNILSKR